MGKQLPLPFDQTLAPGWTGKRYLLCTDGAWHLVVAIRDNMVADTQCCEDVQVVLPVPDHDTSPMCGQCTSLQFGPKPSSPNAVK